MPWTLGAPLALGRERLGHIALPVHLATDEAAQGTFEPLVLEAIGLFRLRRSCMASRLARVVAFRGRCWVPALPRSLSPFLWDLGPRTRPAAPRLRGGPAG